jgi:murein DD-endopeptidase MepM/ murein hydrolase activator NlpD
MTARRPGISIILQRDGALTSRQIRLSLAGLRALTVLGTALLMLGVMAIAFYAPIARQAARVPGLEREVERLTVDNARVRELALALDSVEASYRRLRGMLGADIVPDPVALSTTLAVAPAIVVEPLDASRRVDVGPSLPRRWPLDERGFVTRGYAAAGADEPHSGVDVALPVGSLVRAAGGGTVVQTGDEPEYGRFVLLSHPEGYHTMYGHLSRITVAEGDLVSAGFVVGRSGNTGRSSAPHLHFEVRHNGVSIDPLRPIEEGG